MTREEQKTELMEIALLLLGDIPFPISIEEDCDTEPYIEVELGERISLCFGRDDNWIGWGYSVFPEAVEYGEMDEAEPSFEDKVEWTKEIIWAWSAKV